MMAGGSFKELATSFIAASDRAPHCFFDLRLSSESRYVVRVPDNSFKEFVPGQLSARVKKSIFIAAAIFAPFVAARADLVMEQESGGTNITDHVTVKLHGDKMRMDQRTDKGRGFSVIVDLTTRDSITLMPNEKMFLKRSGAESRQQMEAERTAAHGTNDMDNPPAPPVNTGLTAKVDGYDTEIYKWSGTGGVTETLWVATNFPDYSTIQADLARIDRFNASGAHRNAQPELGLLPGMVVKTEKTANGRKVTISLVSAKVEPVATSLFELPSDYSEWKPTAPPQATNAVPTPKR
jgi:hypothetical protein